MKIKFITGNKGKFTEASEVIPDLIQDDIDLMEIQSLDSREIVKNKLESFTGEKDEISIVEDNSLVLECMNGLPGPLIKWFLKTVGNSGLVKIASAFENFKAEAKIVLGVRFMDGKVEYFEGSVLGKIVPEKGDNGFGWDKIFIPEGQDKTYAEMSLQEKNEVSPRKIAFQKLKAILAEKNL